MPTRLNVVLSTEHAEKLQRLADRTHVNPGTLARSLLTTAIDDADPDARTVTDILDRLDGAFERAQLGVQQAAAGDVINLDEL